MTKTKFTQVRVRKATLDKIKKLLTEYIGKTGKLISITGFLDVLSRVRLEDLPD